MPPQVIIITGASSGFGSLASRLLAKAGHIVYAGMRNHELDEIAEAETFAKENSVELRTVILDVLEDASVNAAVKKVIDECDHIDTVVHNAGQGSIGPAEAFTPEELMHYININAIGTQRLNRAALPHLRSAGKGLLVWVTSSSARGGGPPFIAPYFAAKAAMDSLAVSYAGELARFGIETSIIIPGAHPTGTKHFSSLGEAADKSITAAYMEGPYKGVLDQIVTGLNALTPDNVDPINVAKAIAHVIDLPRGTRPFRTHVDPSEDGAEIVNGMADRVRAELLRRIGLEDLLKPSNV